jgi:hypothetical protein
VYLCIIEIDQNLRDYRMAYDKPHPSTADPRTSKRQSDSRGFYSNYPKPLEPISSRHTAMLRAGYDNYLVNKR